jgi:hypothetical protein
VLVETAACSVNDIAIEQAAIRRPLIGNDGFDGEVEPIWSSR